MGGKPKTPKASDTEKERQARIAQGTTKVNQAFAGYDDPYYAKRAEDYSAWAMPQVEDQYKKAQEQLLYALTRQMGSTNTSEATTRQAELAKNYGIAKTQQTDTGLALANSARSNIENARSQVLAELSASADPNSAATSALNRADLASHVDPYTPLGELFANVTEGLASTASPYGLLNPPSYGFGGGKVNKKPAYIV
jgi:hypothetical protein